MGFVLLDNDMNSQRNFTTWVLKCVEISHFLSVFSKEEQHITVCSSFYGCSHLVYFALIYANVFYRSRWVLWYPLCKMANSLSHP